MKTVSCPCGSDKIYQQCCAPFHSGQKNAATAELLMRSRYTAFVLKKSAYLLNTWASDTRPDTLALKNEQTRWIGLKILAKEKGGPGDDQGSVTFQAHYLLGSSIYTMEERSIFFRTDSRWYYKDGETKISSKAVARNEVCPCGSSKKFKRCCLV